MHITKLILAAGAVSAFSTAAFAADLAMAPPPQYYAPPPADDFGGWYLRGDIGFSNQKVKEKQWHSYGDLLSLDQTNEFGTAGIFGVGIGYQINNWLRVDATGQYRGNSNFNGTDRFTYSDSGVATPGIDTYTAGKSEWLVMANAYVDLGTWWSVTPFIGAGIGMSRNTISNYVDTNTPTLGVATASSDSKWNLAWALHTGLAYRVNPALTIELGYSYMHLGDGQTGVVSTFDAPTLGNRMVFKDITSHDLKLGVRWNLDSPQVYAPPPLMRRG
jgi:opacity protein-like surface antigen